MVNRKDLAPTRTFIIGMIIIFAGVIATNPPTRNILILYTVLLAVSYGVYRFSDFQDKLVPLNFKGLVSLKDKTLGRSLFFGGIAIGVFFVATNLVPGLSLGLPILPGTISDQFRFVTILLIAPIVEEIFFRSVVIGFLRNTAFGKKNIILVITIGAIFFALAHVGAYITGIYNYPDLPTALSAFGANIGSFVVAGLFGFLAGFFLLKPKIQNLAFAIIFHMGLNFIVLRPFVLVQ